MATIPGRAEHVATFGKIYRYPDGSLDIVASSAPIFKPKGLETAGKEKAAPGAAGAAEGRREKRQPKADKEDLERARSRARSKVRRLALANEFRWFVTLTIDPAKLDSYDVAAVTRRLNQWLSNQVKRRGLRYVLVPEFHQSGRVHYHGFFSDSMEAVDSGTITGVPGSKRPRKPRSKAQRSEWLAAGGKVVYNLPGWPYGFTTAIELYGEYAAAVAYVTKYIGKDSQKIGGRWYSSGGALAQPLEEYLDISEEDVARIFTNHWEKQVPGARFTGVNGIKGAKENGNEWKID